MLTAEDEERALTAVSERLAGYFPDIGAADIGHAVHRSYQTFDGRPIRDFVLVLVERMALESLRTGKAQLEGQRPTETALRGNPPGRRFPSASSGRGG